MTERNVNGRRIAFGAVIVALSISAIFLAPGLRAWFSPEPATSKPGGTGMAHNHGQGGEPTHGKDEISHYTCPMHPSVKQHEPGSCPICGMDLTPVTKQEIETGTVVIDEGRRQRIGVRTAVVARKKLSLSIRAVGKVTYDESRLSDVNLRISGWVDRLFANETGAKVRRGQRLMTLYSPELYAAQLEYVSAVGNSAASLSGLKNTAKDRLRLLGMSAGQIATLEKTGKAMENVPIFAPSSGYVVEKNVVQGAQIEAGTRVYRIANLDTVWVDAEVYESDLPNVSRGQNVTVTLPYLPGKSFSGQVDYIYPTLQGDTRTGRIRVVLENPALALKPDMYANVQIEIPLGTRLVIPASAVIYTGPRRLVFVDMGEGRLQPTEVELGVYSNTKTGLYEVTSGLSEGQSVVSSGNFLIAAESRIRSAAEYWESTDDAQ